MAHDTSTALEGVEEKLDTLKGFLNRYLADANRARDCCWETEVEGRASHASPGPRAPSTSDVLHQQRQRHKQSIAALRQRIEEQEREIAALNREHSALVSSRQF